MVGQLKKHPLRKFLTTSDFNELSQSLIWEFYIYAAFKVFLPMIINLLAYYVDLSTWLYL